MHNYAYYRYFVEIDKWFLFQNEQFAIKMINENIARLQFSFAKI